MKIKWNYFSLLNHSFIVLCELLMPYQLFAQKCSNCQEIKKNIKMLGVSPNTLSLVSYIGIFCYWVLLHYNMSFKTIASGFNGAFWWYGPCTFWRLRKNLTNLPKLSCGFNIVHWHQRHQPVHVTLVSIHWRFQQDLKRIIYLILFTFCPKENN